MQLSLKHLWFTCVALLSLSWTQAQENLYDLRQGRTSDKSSELFEEEMSSARDGRSINVERGRFIYMIDTLDLPFFDDFSRNNIKQFNAQIDDPNISLKIDYDFRVNGDAPGQLMYMHDTTQYTIKALNGDLTFVDNPPLFITFYNEGKPVARDTGWTNILESFDEASGLVTFDTLIPDEELINSPDTFYRVADSPTLWVPPTDTFDSLKGAPFVNNTYAKNALTQGVATFDGTDRFGFPYDITSETAYGSADQLISKPLNLDSNMSNVVLSFFYQAGGNGNMPDEEDSLTLQFFDVQDSIWRSAWSITGPPLEDTNFSQQVYVPVEGRPFLQPGFRFRFMNYATLSGSLDHWHIDYVRLAADRDTTREDTINDVAFVSGVKSFLKDFMAVPYSHYLENPSFFETDRVVTEAVNLGGIEAFMQGLRYEVFDPTGAPAFSAITSSPNIGGFTRQQTFYPIEDEALFPDIGTSSADFEVRCRFTAAGLSNEQQINDTIRTYQEFRNYYAYDDGTAEKAYGLTGAGLKLAYEFNTPIADTLKAIYFNFPQILHDDNEELPIEILVWENLESDPIYVSEQLVTPTYTDANQFVRIKLEEPIPVQNRFFIGFRQVEATKIYIGFDVNTDVSDFIYYQINGTWFVSSFSGALMMRPHFSDQDLLGTPEVVAPLHRAELQIYPNPARERINIVLPQERVERVQIVDLFGRTVYQREGYNLNAIDVSMVSSGAYIIQAFTEEGKVYSQKAIIQH